ncbi:hypothetical protein DFP73DRAFT_529803 [Morchella snyderi]|nr:hypothetical protein DFP73DRAFT_529803 [Morchella snyderi]
MSSSPARFTTVAEYAEALAEDPYEFYLTESMMSRSGSTSDSDSERKLKDLVKESGPGRTITKVSNIRVSDSRIPFPLVNAPVSHLQTQQDLLVSSMRSAVHHLNPLIPTRIANTHTLRHVAKSRKRGDDQSFMSWQNTSRYPGADSKSKSADTSLSHKSHHETAFSESTNGSVEGPNGQGLFQHLTRRWRHPNIGLYPKNRSGAGGIGVTLKIAVKQVNHGNNNRAGGQQFNSLGFDLVEATSSDTISHSYDYDRNHKNTNIAATGPDRHETGLVSIGHVKNFGKQLFDKTKKDVSAGSGKGTRGRDASVWVV